MSECAGPAGATDPLWSDERLNSSGETASWLLRSIRTVQPREREQCPSGFNHLLFSPTDPSLLMFCHEGPWHNVERIWIIRADGTQLKKIHTRTMAMEIFGHEFWSADGKRIWYDLQTPRGEVFWLASYDIDTGERSWYSLQRNEWSIHFNISRDGKLFCGDGGDPGQVARAPDGQWIYLFRPELISNRGIEDPGFIRPGVLRAERLVNMSKHDYRLEPNPSFTPDQKWVVFRSKYVRSHLRFRGRSGQGRRRHHGGVAPAGSCRELSARHSVYSGDMGEPGPRRVVPISESRSGPGSTGAPTDRLDSWKEIAAYLRRGTRTVQRWERDQGLPVHRLRHDKLGSVYAYKRELDAWWETRAAELEQEAPLPDEQEPSIAVLPFCDMSREKDQEYFCEGIAEEILLALSKIQGLRVASRMSAFRFKGEARDVREVGRRLRVRHFLEGSVRKAEGRLRIAVQLTDTESGYQLWSERYDREVQDVFAIQEEIARRVVEALEIRLSPKERAALGAAPTRDVQAYDYYLRGRRFYYGYGPQDIGFARQLFTQAIAVDPAYALAYAGLADCWSYIYLNAERSEVAREQADWASARAVELDPASAQAHASRAVALSLNERDEEAQEAFETALRLDPDLFEAHYFYARHLFSHGQKADAVRFYEEAMRVRPEDYQSPLLVAQSYDDLGNPEAARSARLRGIELAEQHVSLNPDDVRAHYMAANGMAALGQNQRAREWAERALALRPDDAMLLYNVGCIFSLLGCVEPAVECLEKAFRHGLRNKGWYENDSNLDPLRDHPRFEALMRQL
jgi:TolB-like protein/Tfp pilus assembly protein PilF